MRQSHAPTRIPQELGGADGIGLRRLPPAAGAGRRLPGPALRLRPGRRRLGPDQLLRPEGQHPRRAGDQPLGRERRDPPGRQHPLRPVRRQRGVLREVPRPHAGHQRRGRADELPHGGNRSQLERTELRGLSGHDRGPGRARGARPSGQLRELRGVLGNRGPHPLHPARQPGPVALDRLPARRGGVAGRRLARGQRLLLGSGLGRDETAAHRDRAAPGQRGGHPARRVAPTGSLPGRLRLERGA